MRLRILIACLILAGTAMFWTTTRHAHAQADGEQRVASLSSTGHEEAHSVVFSPDGQLVAVGGTSGIYFFHTLDLSRAGFIETGTWARSLTFIPRANLLAAGLFDHTIKFWSVPDNHLIRTFNGPTDWVWSISVSRDGSLIAAASGDDTIRIWRTADGTPLLTLDKAAPGVRAIALSPDGKFVAAALRDKTVRVWRVVDGELLYTLSGHTDWVRCVAFSPDGKLLASGSFDTTIRLWDMSDGQLLRILKGNTSSVLSVAFSPDGNTLASGSEDDARLWQVSDGKLLHLLEGHTSFVYAVSFSPDGRTLATGGADNTMRLWDLQKVHAEKPAPSSQNVNAEAGPLDCRKCHHPRGQALPPRVSVLPCEGCHSQGANLEWCPGIARASDASMPPVQYAPYVDQVGVPIGGDGIAVWIASPSNGETLYAKNGMTAPAIVTGQVYSGTARPDKMQVQLEIWSGSQKTTELTATPSAAGQFKFNLGINPRGSIPYIIKPGGADCVPCHEDYRSQAEMPAGEVHIRVTVVDENGHQASDERWFRVDESGQASLPVQVIDSLTDEPLSGVSVNASTILYDWRDRFGNAATGTDGMAQLHLESLSQAVTTYSVSVPPQVVNGVLYASQPAQIPLQPGEDSLPPITLRASAQAGQIAGKLDGADLPASSNSIKVWAVQLPAGPAYQSTLTAQDTFAFGPIPVGRYAVSLDLPGLAAQGLAGKSQVLDLIQSPTSTAALQVAKGKALSGNITDEQGGPLPFAWVRINGKGLAQPADPTSSSYLIPSFPAEASFVTVSAPGYYSVSRHVSAAEKSLDVQLVAQPETSTVAWGSGYIVIPAQTRVEVKNSEIDLNSGWLWGSINASRPLTLQLPGVRVDILDGRFALEDAAGQTSWLYLYQGNAQVSFAAQPPVSIQAGEMLALEPSASPFPMDETAFLALHPPLDEVPVAELIQPSFAARLGNWLEKAGIGAAQLITFITYILSLVALFAIPVFGLFWVKNRRKDRMSRRNA